MRFLLKYASRSRPRLFQKRVLNWTTLASKQHELRWLCSFDRDDRTMDNLAMAQWCRARGLTYYCGGSRTKVEAINADLGKHPATAPWDIAIIVSDDMAVKQAGWDATVARDMEQHFPALDGALWYLDGRRTDLCTLSIMGRKVFDELQYLYHPAFATAYCDDYFHQLMQQRGKLARIETPVFCHEWRQENNDALMARNEDRQTYARDKDTFERLMRELAGG